MQPYLTSQIGAADSISVNLPLNDPMAQKIRSTVGDIEIWFYGRDMKLKQVFVLVSKERYKDYGATSMTGGSARLGSGSGVNLLITGDGPEQYLTRYITQNYSVNQRNTVDILNDITTEIRSDGYLIACLVDDSLNMPLDIDLSWENIQTAVGNLINQVGGYMYIDFYNGDPTQRVLNIVPLPGDLAQPINVGTTSPVLPQLKREAKKRATKRGMKS
jgi:hypothetical protein